MTGAKTSTTASVNERYLVAATVTKVGAAVPAEWYELYYKLAGVTFGDLGTNKTHVLASAKPIADVGHFRTGRISDLPGPVVLKNIEGIQTLVGPGGRAILGGGASSVTLDVVSRKLGPRDVDSQSKQIKR